MYGIDGAAPHIHSKIQKNVIKEQSSKYSKFLPIADINKITIERKRGTAAQATVNFCINENIQNNSFQVTKEYKIKSQTDPKNIGIWIKKNNEIEKIAAIGLRVKKWIAFHGFSLNINNDLSLYQKIVPCGIKDKNVTSFEKIGISNYENINDVIKKNFLNTFL